MKNLKTDILILGAGGAGLFAALHAHQRDPKLSITVAVKGLLGKCGCTRMVQGGYNVALAPGDSVERHFMDTIEGGKWLPGTARSTRRRLPARASTARCTRATSPASKSSTASPNRSGRAASRGWRSTARWR